MGQQDTNSADSGICEARADRARVRQGLGMGPGPKGL